MPSIETQAGSPPLFFKLLRGEKIEAMRGDVGGSITRASAWLELGNPKKALIAFAHPILRMPDNVAKALVNDAMAGINGTKVTFKTVFEQPTPKGSIPRHCEDFRIVHRGSR